MKTITPNIPTMIICSLFFCLQITLTYLNQNIWPFSGHAFFSFRPGETIYLKRIVIEDEQGNAIYGHPANYMPLEFFKANRVIIHMFTDSNITDSEKSDFLTALLDNAKYHPWSKFDETYASVSIPEEFVASSIRYEVIPRTYPFDSQIMEPIVSDPIVQFTYTDNK
ncbi:hypothetical protein [Vibrio bivalvicida]|uniref:Uncharacterized protein n=1 Tax=Vibrio bivalvicida TaxID=1276888 RepID=A0ABV4MP86_9VIBR